MTAPELENVCMFTAIQGFDGVGTCTDTCQVTRHDLKAYCAENLLPASGALRKMNSWL